MPSWSTRISPSSGPHGGTAGGLFRSSQATAHIEGTVANPRGAVNLEAANGSIAGQPFDRAHMQVNLSDQLLTVPAAYIQSGAGRVDLTADFRHPRDSFIKGTLSAHLQSNRIDLAGLRAFGPAKPSLTGALQLNATLTGTLAGNPADQFSLNAVDADV